MSQTEHYGMLDAGDWTHIKSLDYPTKYWFTCFIFALAGEAEEIYFYEDAAQWLTTFRRKEGHFQLTDAAPEFYNEVKLSLISLFISDALHRYVSNGSSGHLSLILDGRVVNGFIWFDSHKNFTIKFIYDDVVPALARDLIARYKDGDIL
jgi:hypothetical protein